MLVEWPHSAGRKQRAFFHDYPSPHITSWVSRADEKRDTSAALMLPEKSAISIPARSCTSPLNRLGCSLVLTDAPSTDGVFRLARSRLLLCGVFDMSYIPESFAWGVPWPNHGNPLGDRETRDQGQLVKDG